MKEISKYIAEIINILGLTKKNSQIENFGKFFGKMFDDINNIYNLICYLSIDDMTNFSLVCKKFNSEAIWKFYLENVLHPYLGRPDKSINDPNLSFKMKCLHRTTRFDASFECNGYKYIVYDADISHAVRVYLVGPRTILYQKLGIIDEHIFDTDRYIKNLFVSNIGIIVVFDDYSIQFMPSLLNKFFTVKNPIGGEIKQVQANVFLIGDKTLYTMHPPFDNLFLKEYFKSEHDIVKFMNYQDKVNLLVSENDKKFEIQIIGTIIATVNKVVDNVIDFGQDVKIIDGNVYICSMDQVIFQINPVNVKFKKINGGALIDEKDRIWHVEGSSIVPFFSPWILDEVLTAGKYHVEIRTPYRSSLKLWEDLIIEKEVVESKAFQFQLGLDKCELIEYYEDRKKKVLIKKI